MFSGSSLSLWCILPLGMLCLSAVRMMFVNILVDAWTLVGSGVLCSMVSISWVYAGQFAFL